MKNRYAILDRAIAPLILTVIATGCGNIRSTEKFQKAILPPQSVVFIGDSITYYWGQADVTSAFGQHPNWNDQGLIGQNSSQLVLRFEDDVVFQHPKIVHIVTGTNDVYPGWVLCGGNAVYDTCGNIKAMVNMAIAAGIQPVLGTIPPWGSGPTATAADPSPERYQRIDQLNAWIKQYGQDAGISVADYHAALASSNGKNYDLGLTVDGVHPTAAGFNIMTPLAAQAFRYDEMK